MDGYTGEGEPPCIVMMLRTDSGMVKPPDFTLPVILTGVNQSCSSSIILELKGELPLAGYKFTSQEETTG